LFNDDDTGVSPTSFRCTSLSIYPNTQERILNLSRNIRNYMSLVVAGYLVIDIGLTSISKRSTKQVS